MRPLAGVARRLAPRRLATPRGGDPLARDARQNADLGALRQTIHEYFSAVDANDLDRLLSCFHPDATYARPGYAVIRGVGQLRHFYQEERVIARGLHTLDCVVVDGVNGAAWGTFVGVSRAGERLEERWCDAYQFSGNRILHRRTHFFRAAI